VGNIFDYPSTPTFPVEAVLTVLTTYGMMSVLGSQFC